MNYLTIEKFSPPGRSGILRLLGWALTLLVVPVIMAAVWLWLNLDSLGLAAADGEEIIGRSGEASTVVENYSFTFPNQTNRHN